MGDFMADRGAREGDGCGRWAAEASAGALARAEGSAGGTARGRTSNRNVAGVRLRVHPLLGGGRASGLPQTGEVWIIRSVRSTGVVGRQSPRAHVHVRFAIDGPRAPGQRLARRRRARLPGRPGLAASARSITKRALTVAYTATDRVYDQRTAVTVTGTGAAKVAGD